MERRNIKRLHTLRRVSDDVAIGIEIEVQMRDLTMFGGILRVDRALPNPKYRMSTLIEELSRKLPHPVDQQFIKQAGSLLL